MARPAAEVARQPSSTQSSVAATVPAQREDDAAVAKEQRKPESPQEAPQSSAAATVPAQQEDDAAVAKEQKSDSPQPEAPQSSSLDGSSALQQASPLAGQQLSSLQQASPRQQPGEQSFDPGRTSCLDGN